MFITNTLLQMEYKRNKLATTYVYHSIPTRCDPKSDAYSI